MWLERCLDARTLVPPEADVASTPVPKFPIPGMSFKIIVYEPLSYNVRIQRDEDLLHRIRSY